MASRSASARWEGSLQEGEGLMKLGSGAFEGNYNFTNRFGDDSVQTNPEEMVAAAHAGCFSMQLNNDLHKNGTPPDYVDTKVNVTLRRVDEKPTITEIEIVTEASVPGMDDATFQQFAEAAKDGCLISRLYAGGTAEFKMTATLK